MEQTELNQDHSQQIDLNKTVVNKPIGINLRHDLEMSHLEDGSFQIRDPEVIRYFHLGLEEAEVITLMQTMHPKQVAERTSFSEDDLKRFLGMLKGWGLLEGTVAPRRQQQSQKTLIQLFFKRYKIAEPDSFFDDWTGKLAFLGSNPAKVFYGVLLAWTSVVFYQKATDLMAYGWPSILDSWPITTAIFVLLLFVTLSFHELAHGFCLKYFGGKIPEIGFYFSYATPALYTDVSDMYNLPRKRDKIWVMAIGPLVQIILGCLSFLAWSEAVPHTFIADIFFLSFSACFFSLSMNLNPLIRLDSYYILQIGLGVYSLRRRAWTYFLAKLTGKKLPEYPTARERKIFLLYAPLSIIYTTVIMFVMLTFYFGQSFVELPAVTLLLVLLLYAASQTPLARGKKAGEPPTTSSAPSAQAPQ